LRRLIPQIEREDLVQGGAGVRAQAVYPHGNFIDDFRILEAKKMIHVLNAPSPGGNCYDKYLKKDCQ
jgi:L-2-hydroxyglutarate oxidase